MARLLAWSCVYYVDVHFGCSGGSRRLQWFLLLGTCLFACSEVLPGVFEVCVHEPPMFSVELVPPLVVLGRCICVWCSCGPNIRVRSVWRVRPVVEV